MFSNQTFGDDTDIIARPWDTDGLGIAADRLADGEDNTVHVGMRAISGGGSTRGGLESQVFEYAPGLNLVGDDLQGYTVTGIRVQLDIEVTESNGWWTQAYTCTLTVLGH